MREKAVESHVLLDAGRLNIDLWRNNSGAFKDDYGHFIRYGLGSFTKNDELASGDLIGITPTLILPHMVGQILGVFTNVETKPTDWKFSTADKRCLRQKNFNDKVIASGGYAGFCQNVDDFRRIINRE